MKMNSVKSSQVESHGYDPVTKTMAVKFKSGHTYHYADVPQAKYDGFTKAESFGKHLSAHIKGKHEFKLQPAEKKKP